MKNADGSLTLELEDGRSQTVDCLIFDPLIVDTLVEVMNTEGPNPAYQRRAKKRS